MFANTQSSFTGQPGSSGGAATGGSTTGLTTNRSSATPRQASPTYHHHIGTYGYTQPANAYPHHQDYSMYSMDPAVAWQAYSGFYRGYDMATATSAFAESVWPHSTHHPFGNVSSVAAVSASGGHHDGVDPLDPLQMAASSSATTDNFGSALHNNSETAACHNRETDSPEYKPSHFLSGSDPQQDNPTGRSGTATRPSPDSGLTISDGVSSSGSPNQNNQSGHHLTSNMGGMMGSPGSSPPPGSELLNSNRPQPARSPYEWIKRPNFQSRNLSSSKEGRTRTKDKYRVVYSDHQRLELEKEFHYSRYITIRRKSELAQGLGLSERQVKIWFQNRRAKERKQMKKRDELIHKEKLDVAAAAAGFHHHHQAAAAAAAAAQAAAAAAFSVPASQMLHHSHHSLSHLQP